MASRGLICVSIAENDDAAVLAAVTPVLPMVDVIEIRLDCMRKPQIARCIDALNKPILVTNRPSWEGGLCRTTEQERIDLLCQALQWGARYVDIELKATQEMREQVQNQASKFGARVIFSSHDFYETPNREHLEQTLDLMIVGGADIAKIVVTAAGPMDCLRILALQERAVAAHFPLSAFAMGAAGAISRLATLFLGGFMTYTALSPEQATAPGQLSVHTLQALLTQLEVQP